MHWRGGASQIVDAVRLKQDGLCDVVSDKLETRVRKEPIDVALSAGKEVVQT
jgi:hypothetical protein